MKMNNVEIQTSYRLFSDEDYRVALEFYDDRDVLRGMITWRMERASWGEVNALADYLSKMKILANRTTRKVGHWLPEALVDSEGVDLVQQRVDMNNPEGNTLRIMGNEDEALALARTLEMEGL